MVELKVREEDGRTILEPTGDWLAPRLAPVDAELRRIERDLDPGSVVIDLRGLGRIDTAGAYVLGRALNRCGAPDGDFHFVGEHDSARRLMRLAHERINPCPDPDDSERGVVDVLARVGEGVLGAISEFISSLAFFGELVLALGRAVMNPARVRWASLFTVMETAGLNALPIVATLSFFVGAVVAYLGASLLRQFGADALAVELVAFAVLREFGVVITAILVAGRSDSAFTAKIGAMRMQQEIDAMRVLGLDVFDALVVPRFIALMVMLPLLTFAAMIMGLLGGLVVLWAVADVAPNFYVARIQDNISISHFWVGMSKTLAFAPIIAVIGCRHGLQVRGDVESLGRHVTASVVQSIFAVIIVDAIFAMIYLELGW